jgi:hypothetical protein
MSAITQTRKLGSLDFVRMIHDGQPEYSLLAVKAPIEDVIEAFIEFRSGQSSRKRSDWRSMTVKTDALASRQLKWDKNIALLPEGTECEGEFEQGMPIPVLQVANSEWVVIIRSLSWLDSEQIDNVPLEAKFLSQKFQTDAITLMEEDTSASISYELFQQGESIESLEFCDAEEYRFESKRQEDPQFQADEDEDFEDEDLEDEDLEDEDDGYDIGKRQEMQFVDRTFADLGLYLPAVWYGVHEGQPALQIMSASADTVSRADWITIQEEWAVETVTPDEDDAE